MRVGKNEISLKQCLGILLFLVGSTYFLYQARFMVLGPMVEITYPQSGAQVASSVVSVEGRARNVAWITLNDRQIYTDTEGHWSEQMVVPPGTNVMTVRSKDRFGRETEKTIEIYAN